MLKFAGLGDRSPFISLLFWIHIKYCHIAPDNTCLVAQCALTRMPLMTAYQKNIYRYMQWVWPSQGPAKEGQESVQAHVVMFSDWA
jgi:hypothetical protein